RPGDRIQIGATEFTFDGTGLRSDAPNPADATPAPDRRVYLNGQEVKHGEPTRLSDGDVLSLNGKEVRVNLPESNPLIRELKNAPREQQLSLARLIEKAKDPGALFKALKDSSLHGAAELMQAVAEVFAGKSPLLSLPTELGLRAKVKAMLEAQVADLKKAGLEMTPGTVLRPELRDARMTPLELEFQTLKAMEMLSAQVSMSRGFAELLQVLGAAPFESIGGVKVESIFDLLGHEKLKGVLEQVEKSKEELQKKIDLATKKIDEEEGKAKSKLRWINRPNKELAKELKEKLEKWKEELEQ